MHLRASPARTPRGDRPCGAAAALLCLLALALVVGCARRIDPSRGIVRQLRFHGVRQISEGALRQRIATQSTSYVLGLVRLPWSDVEYFDPTTFRRDVERVVRYYQSQGFYSASVQATRIEPSEPGSRWLDLDVTVREGSVTKVGTVWLSGCEPESVRPEDRWRLSAEACRRIRERMQLRLGAPFTETALNADRQLIADLMRERGFATARVFPRATVDPVQRRAHVVFVLVPGPPARFGEVAVYESPATERVTGDLLPRSHLPLGPIRSATHIQQGDPYRLSALADAQRALFDLGVFGIVRIEERPVRCDSRGRCGAARDRSDPGGFVRVDLAVRLSPTRLRVARLGGGFEFSQTQSNVHLLASWEHRNLRLPGLGRMWRLRIDERPALFLTNVFDLGGSAQAASQFPLGNLLGVELRRPEVWPGGALVLGLLSDLGPDVINPNLAFRHRGTLRGAVEQRLHRGARSAVDLLLGLRVTRVDFINLDPYLALDPIYRQQYINHQTYAYLEQQLTWDRRDSPLQTRYGTYAAVAAQESVSPVFGQYTFLRNSLDLRGYVPLGSNFVFAVRGFGGAVLGTGGVEGWPVPQELRFYSGGANSNRGYPFYRVGYITTVPEFRCPAGTQPGVLCPGGEVVEDQVTEGGRPDESRLAAVGGLLAWEFSAELRWYFGNFGLVGFFDASDVRGWSPGMIPARETDPMTGQLRPPPAAPSARMLDFGFDPHPSAGLGLRYISPIGVIRLDLGVRLDDLGCTTFRNDVLATNRSTPMHRPWYYAVTRPQCDLLGLPLPVAFNFAIGEAY